MRRFKKPRCEACNKTDCPGWQEGQPIHEFRGKGKWFLGCHCENCWKARLMSGGFIGALVDHLAGPSPKTDEDLPYQCDACSTPGYSPDAKCECTPTAGRAALQEKEAGE